MFGTLVFSVFNHDHHEVLPGNIIIPVLTCPFTCPCKWYKTDITCRRNWKRNAMLSCCWAKPRSSWYARNSSSPSLYLSFSVCLHFSFTCSKIRKHLKYCCYSWAVHLTATPQYYKINKMKISQSHRDTSQTLNVIIATLTLLYGDQSKSRT